jgi:AcrR family transcriptional regulator
MNDTRRSLLDATRRCVRDRGIGGATSREITAAAGANLAAITYHFGSKEELLAEALFGELERRIAPALESLGEIDRGESLAPDDPLRSATDPVAQMLVAVQQLLAEFERSRRDALVYLEALLMAAHDPRYRRRALRLLGAVRRRLSSLIATLRDDDTVPAWVEPDAMASLIMAVANGIALQTQLEPRGPDQVAMASQFAGLLVGVSR